MNTTIPGGAYKDATGDGWHDADGKPLTKAQIAEAQKLIAEQQAALDELEARRAERDPDALKAIAAMLRPATAAQPADPKDAK